MERMTSLRQQQQKCYKPDESTLYHILVWDRVQTTGIFDKHLSLVDITPLERCTSTNIGHWSVNLTKVKWITHSRLLIKDRHVSFPLLFHTWQSLKGLVVVDSQYQSVVRVVSWERVHNVYANNVKMYPSTNVSQVNQPCKQIHRYARASFYCTSTIIGTFFNHTIRETAPLNNNVGRQDNVSNVVCQAEKCLSGIFLSLISPHICVLDTYATAKIEMVEAWRSKHANPRPFISLSQNLVNIMEREREKHRRLTISMVMMTRLHTRGVTSCG
jgi:hypothetical protein